ncbi:hypothetical protein VTL71DRAFT_10201 [Oculimacula yallundae]|uniref:CorA-like transporter domain-containing protein n=1 Tax=Oculimacula yallundae TaxID=86028 RepID=A0ABR4BPW6_9HELO
MQPARLPSQPHVTASQSPHDMVLKRLSSLCQQTEEELIFIEEMGTLNLPIDFINSYTKFKSFPLNLVHRSGYFGAQQASIDRLNDVSSRVFTQKDDDVEVPIRDLAPSGKEFIRRYIINDDKLRVWLGDSSATDPNTQTNTGCIATIADPKCRFIYHQVMPSYIDMISVFGSQLEARELRFSGFREQTILSSPDPGTIIPDLGRSGKQFQLCYHLKTVDCTSIAALRAQDKTWSIRPATFLHQFDVVYGTTLWIVTKGEVDDIKKSIQDVTGVTGRPTNRAFGTSAECFVSSLTIHLLYCHWSTKSWVAYLEWLEFRIDSATDLVVVGPRTFDGDNLVRREYTPKDLQITQSLEDKVNETMVVMESNMEVLMQLRGFYEGLSNNAEFDLRQTCTNAMYAFSTQVNDMVYDLRVQIRAAKLLVRKTSDRKTLILQHLQSQATDKMESLTLSMHREAIAVRIITVVTLLYLPATFVSTFFSTDVIKYQNGDPGGTFSRLALNRWLQVTLPLTALTLAVGYLAFKMEDIKRQFRRLPEEMELGMNRTVLQMMYL